MNFHQNPYFNMKILPGALIGCSFSLSVVVTPWMCSMGTVYFVLFYRPQEKISLII